MDKVIFVKRLSEVFEFLLNLQDPITDDTCLQRLQDILNDQFSDKDCPGMNQFIEKACERLDNLELSVLAFALHLSGQAVSKGRVSSGVTRLYQTISEKKLWKDSSVGTAYFNSLNVVARTLHGWKWVTQENPDFLQEALSSLQENTSLFLHASARQFLVTVLAKHYQMNGDAGSINLDCITNISDRICKDFNRELNQATMSPGRGLNVYLHNLVSLVGSSDLLLENLQEEVLQHVLKLCLTVQTGSSTGCEDLLLQCLRCNSQRVSDFLKKEFLSLCTNGLKNIDVCKYHKLAVRFHQSFPEVDESNMLEDAGMIPFRVVLGETKPDTLTSECINTFENTMSSKTACTQLMLRTASWVAEKPGHMEDLVSVLGCSLHCEGDGGPMVDGLAGDIRQNLYSSRLQLNLLEGIYKNIDDTVPVDTITKALDVIIEVTSGISTHNGVLEKGHECVISLLVLLASRSEGSDHFKSYLPLVTSRLEKCLVGTQWEHRDTAVESVTKLVTQLQDKPTAVSVISTSILVSAWQCITDSDSYVRASAARLVAKLVSYPHIWDSFLSQLEHTEDFVITKLNDIISTDTEAFPRRAAVLSLLEVYSHRDLTESVAREISSVMMNAMNDFDWEVKANALDFWQHICDQKLKETFVPDYAVVLPSGTKRRSDDGSSLTTNLLELHRAGLFVALWCGLEDYDQHVCEKTYTILNNLKQKIKFDDLNEIELKKSKCENGPPGSRTGSTLSNELGFEGLGSDNDCLTTVLDIMRETNFEEKLSVMSGSVDEYSKNPIALLEDILSEDKDNKEDKFVDCY